MKASGYQSFGPRFVIRLEFKVDFVEGEKLEKNLEAQENQQTTLLTLDRKQKGKNLKRVKHLINLWHL